jgi:hypothetical protein
LPLVMKRAAIERAAAIASQNGGVVAIKPLQKARAGLVVTGNEVYHGLFQDRFAPTLTGKIEALGSEVTALEFAPDDAEAIARAIRSHLDRGCNLLLLSGGMSVDPDDVTRHGIRLAGASEMHYGAAVLPGAMFLVAYLGEIPLLGVPACACITGPRPWTWFFRGFWPENISAKPSWPSWATAASPNAPTPTVPSAKAGEPWTITAGRATACVSPRPAPCAPACLGKPSLT